MASGWKSVALSVVCVALSTSCVTSTQATRLQSDLEEIKRQLFQVQQDSAASRSKLEEVDRAVRSQSDAPASGMADLQATLRSLLEQVQALSAKMDEMAARPARPAEPRSGDGGAPGAASGNAGGQADQVFKTAYADFSKGNYELALLGFTEYLTANPGAPLAEDAQYWTGECLYSQGKFKEAAEAFDRCGARHPGGARAAAAMLKKGYSQIEGGQASQGIATLQKLIETHPQTDEARLAAERLKTLGLRTR